MIRTAARDGTGVLVVSSDLAELLRSATAFPIVADGRIIRPWRALRSATPRSCITCCNFPAHPRVSRRAARGTRPQLTTPRRRALERQAARRRAAAATLAQLLLRGERPYMLYIAFAVLLVVFSLASPWFLSIDNFLNIGRQTTLVSIIAVGMTFVIIARQIDLSVASTLALSGMAAALAMAHIDNSWIVGAVAGLGTGALVGLINGLLTTRLTIPSFLVTLGTLSAARGLALMVTNTKPVIITNETYFAIFGEGYVARHAGADPLDAGGDRSPASCCCTTACSAGGSMRPAATRPRRSIPASTSSRSPRSPSS